MFPPQLYYLLASDSQVRWLDPVLVRKGFTGVGVALHLHDVFEVPERSLLLLTAFNMIVNPAGAGLSTSHRLQAIRPGGVVGTDETLMFDQEDTGTSTTKLFQFLPGSPIMFPPGWKIQVRVSFGVADPAHRVDANLFGVVIPLGNVQRV